MKKEKRNSIQEEETKLLEIIKTKNTPSILFNINVGILIITGKSFPEDPETFYSPIFSALKRVKTKNLDITIELEYINTSSRKIILNFLKTAKNYVNAQVIWATEKDDEDMLELGNYLEDFTGLPFEYRKFKTRTFVKPVFS